MSLKLQIILIISSLLSIFLLVDMIRKESLGLKYSLSWLTSAMMILILALFPDLIDYTSLLLGIVNPMNALFFIGNLFLLVIILTLTIAVSRSSVRVKELTQEVALLRYQYENERAK